MNRNICLIGKPFFFLSFVKEPLSLDKGPIVTLIFIFLLLYMKNLLRFFFVL